MADNDKIKDKFDKMVTEEELLKGKTDDQKVALKFLNQIGDSAGCFKKEYVSPSAYMAIVAKQAARYDKDNAINALGIDEDQVREIDPVCFQGFDFEETGGVKEYVLVTSEGAFSSVYEVTWLFFGSDQMYVHRHLFDTTDDTTVDQTEEYFYKDIISFTTENKSIQESVLELTEEGGCGNKEVKRNYTSKMVKSAKFKIGLPGESFRCSYNEGDGSVSSKVNAMKQKLREKKQG
jgi:hypothetical protein